MAPDEKAWNEWLRLPITQMVIDDLRRDYGSELRSCAEAVRKGDGSAGAIAGRIGKAEEILAKFKVSHVDVNVGSPYPDAGDAQDDNRPDPATIADYQTSTRMI
jgi:hypothetical protein